MQQEGRKWAKKERRDRKWPLRHRTLFGAHSRALGCSTASSEHTLTKGKRMAWLWRALGLLYTSDQGLQTFLLPRTGWGALHCRAQWHDSSTSTEVETKERKSCSSVSSQRLQIPRCSCFRKGNFCCLCYTFHWWHIVCIKSINKKKMMPPTQIIVNREKKVYDCHQANCLCTFHYR